MREDEQMAAYDRNCAMTFASVLAAGLCIRERTVTENPPAEMHMSLSSTHFLLMSACLISFMVCMSNIKVP